MDTRARKCYEILGLQPGASPGAIRSAYKDLVKVWHPDRFHNDPRLREKAQEKLKDINEAYQYLLAHPADPEPFSSEGETPGNPPPGRARPRSQETPKASSEVPPTPDAPPTPAASPRAPFSTRRVHRWPGWVRVVSSAAVPLGALALFLVLAPSIVGVLLQLPGIASAPPQDDQPAAERYNNVLLLVTVRPSRRPEYGTAFLIDRTTAMTASHVLISAAGKGTRLLAITGDHHAYRAEVLCRAPLPYRTYPAFEVAFSKDVALVRIDWDAPAESPPPGVLVAPPGDLAPPPAPLHLSPAGPHPGDTVMIVGYGQHNRRTPDQLRATAVVTAVERARDGSAVFSARFLTYPIPGEGGAPMLNGVGEVVGLLAWETPGGEDDGAGVAVPSLTCP